jgi:hypothetical protein
LIPQAAGPIGEDAITNDLYQPLFVAPHQLVDLFPVEVVQPIATGIDLPIAIPILGILPVRMDVQLHLVTRLDQTAQLLSDLLVVTLQLRELTREPLQAIEIARIDEQSETGAVLIQYLDQLIDGLDHAVLNTAHSLTKEEFVIEGDQQSSSHYLPFFVGMNACDSQHTEWAIMTLSD